VERLVDRLNRTDSLKEDFRLIVVFSRDEHWSILAESIRGTCVKLLV
jgi:hypothetical protein